MSWETWGDRLKKHMKDTGVTQDDVAERLNVSQGAVAHWLKGRREINLTDFFKLAAAARADPSYLLFGASEEAVAIAKLKKFIEENPALQTMLASSTGSGVNDAGDSGRTPKRRREDFQ